MANESTIKLTNSELLQFRTAAQMFINTFPSRTKLHYALEKMLKKTTTAFENYADKENEIRVECALLDKDKKFVIGADGRSLVVDPARANDLQSKLRALGREEIEIDTHFATDVPDGLEAMWYQQFLGIVIKEDPLDKEDTAKAA